MDFLSLFRGSCFTGSDRPYGFVSDDQFRELFRGQVENHFFDLRAHHVEIFAVFAFFEFFADAIDRDQVVFVGLNHFLVQRSAGFAVIFAAFAVAENHVFHAQRSDHLSRNFAGVGAFGFGGAVLRSDGDAGSFGVLYDLGQVRKRRNYDEVHARANVAFQCGYAFQQFYAFRRGGVHFPVTCYYFLSHNFSVFNP